MENRLVVVRVGERERKRVGYDYRRDVEGILVIGLFVSCLQWWGRMDFHITHALMSAHKPMKCK